MKTRQGRSRLLLGSGPSNVHPRVLEAMAEPLLGHLDPEFLELLDEVQDRLRTLFGTTNELTLPLSATLTTAVVYDAFQFSDTIFPCGQRGVTISPTQALALLNHSFLHAGP